MTEEEQKQQIVDDIKNLLQIVTPILRAHNDNTWDEDAQGYNLSGPDQLFDVIEHNNYQGQAAKRYNTNDDDSKVVRREVYLAFEYNKEYINAFATLFNKIAKEMRKTFYVRYVKNTLENIMKDIREYAQAYYLQAFDMINKKKDELEKLSLDNLNILHNEIQEAKTNIVNVVHKIKEDYDKDIEVGNNIPRNKLRTTANSVEIQMYLESKSKQGEFEKNLNTIKNTASKIMKILISP
ncbi:virulence associated lipoprotein [Borrelia puertoricensis]|uniref:virulence associated lipoprotein n=1 Tax=Borrelia puertoricensis TaxID=2756107 RepID=UPI001FF36971|nr:virulence associated lipoprotein [Borrelia puertoricensis]UPA18939.1 hypothetical protein bpuSUM_001477 [Borrelia puertoricensis]